jgi:protein-S-isoprenylcysteine O-methyltransferase Ste14
MRLFAPVSGLQVALFALIAIGFGVTVLVARMLAPPDDAEARRDWSSYRGILVQSVAIALAASGPVRLSSSTGPRAFVASGTALLLGLAAIALFVSSARTLGKNWSFVARTRGDHRLIKTGPYALVRHPIYTSLFLLMLAFAICLEHWIELVAAIPLFLVGTRVRTVAEERLLEDSFGQEFRDYRAVTPALFPRLLR